MTINTREFHVDATPDGKYAIRILNVILNARALNLRSKEWKIVK